MKLLFDESLPYPIRNEFNQNSAQQLKIDFVQEIGWSGLTNGNLLEKAQTDYDFFITGDTSIHEHTDLNNYSIPVVILHGPTNRLEDLVDLVPSAINCLESSQTKEINIISHE